jgi:hypothetical protein
MGQRTSFFFVQRGITWPLEAPWYVVSKIMQLYLSFSVLVRIMAKCPVSDLQNNQRISVCSCKVM